MPLPVDLSDPPVTTVPLYEFILDGESRRVYSTDPDWSVAGSRRSDKPVCRVWRSPMSTELYWE